MTEVVRVPIVLEIISVARQMSRTQLPKHESRVL